MHFPFMALARASGKAWAWKEKDTNAFLAACLTLSSYFEALEFGLQTSYCIKLYITACQDLLQQNEPLFLAQGSCIIISSS